MGLKIGTDDTPRYVVMETHYDNPLQRTGESPFNHKHDCKNFGAWAEYNKSSCTCADSLVVLNQSGPIENRVLAVKR